MAHRTYREDGDAQRQQCRCPDCLLPPDGPPQELCRKAVPTWLGRSMEDLADELGELEAVEYAEDFAAGFESGLIMAAHKPEWARGFYIQLRNYYLLTHTFDDLADWDVQSERTCQALPVEMIHERRNGNGIT
jgi:hypothetical protein